jgi:hypothetical protein
LIGAGGHCGVGGGGGTESDEIERGGG